METKSSFLEEAAGSRHGSVLKPPLHKRTTGLEEQLSQSGMAAMSFEERLALLIDREVHCRSDRKLVRLLKQAHLKYPQAAIEDIDARPTRGIDRRTVMSLALGDWVSSGLIFNHFQSVQEEVSGLSSIATEDEFARLAFTQKTALEEIVRAAEGVPRDAINVLAICAQKAGNAPIAVMHARTAAKIWFLRDKESAVSANELANALLRWIVDEVIAHRKARAFLIESGTRDALIESLFDSRVLHLLKRNISAQDQPGIRYDAFKIDYGCYVDLLSTAREPQGTWPMGEMDQGDGKYIEVPPDDYRAIRRAILDLSLFKSRSVGRLP